MEPLRPLAPSLIGHGTLAGPRDMLRALETIESVLYCYTVEGEAIHEGKAALVKLMADPDSSTLIVNGCLFLNVASFRYLDFEQLADGQWRFILHGDGATLDLIAVPDAEDEGERQRPHLLMEEQTAGFDVMITLDEDDEDE